MNTSLPRAIAFVVLAVVPPLAAEEPNPAPPKDPPAASNEEVLTQRKAALAVAQETASQTFQAAKALRYEHNIIDMDPEHAGVLITPADDPNVVAYVRLKDAYLKAKAGVETAEAALDAALPADVLQAEIAAVEGELTTVFAKLADILQKGKITDPNPDGKSAITVVENNPRLAATYWNQKTLYLALKARLEKKRKALEGVVVQREAAVAAAKEASRQAYVAAAAARQKHNIIDPYPVGNGVTLSPEDDPNVMEYVRLKEVYLKAKANIEVAEDAWYAARPIDDLQTEAEAAEKDMTAAFAKLAEFLQSGQISDPNPDSANSAVRLNSREREIATSYLQQKSKYLALKGRATKAKKALADAKARKAPAADVTK